MSNTQEEIPEFQYFPDPIGAGSIVRKNAICMCCGYERRFFYTGPIYCRENVDMVCPWCIADGSAAKKWSAEFNDVDGHVVSSVPLEIVDLISKRTPGYSSWQSNRWLFTHSDAMIFHGEVAEVRTLLENPKVLEACRTEFNEWGMDWSDEEFEHALKDGDPAFYIFEDPASGELVAYGDMS